MGHSCRTSGTLLWDTLVGHSCRTLLWDTLVAHSCRTLLWDTLVELCRTLLWGTTKVSKSQPSRLQKVSHETSSKSHASSLQNKHFARAFFQGSLVISPEGAFGTRLPQKLTLENCKTRVSYEISSKSHTSGLQNESFARAVFQKSHVKVSKTSISYETSSKSQAGSSIGAHTSSSPAKQFRDSSPSKQHPLTRQSQCHSDIHLHHNSQPHDSLHLPRIHTSNTHKVLRLPRNVTSATPRNLTIPCTRHENRTSTPLSPHKVLRLPRKVTISYHVSLNPFCTTPHV